jgi:hypothetical protein
MAPHLHSPRCRDTPITTEPRARIGDDGEIVHLMLAFYRGKGSRAYGFIPLGVDLLKFPRVVLDWSICVIWRWPRRD